MLSLPKRQVFCCRYMHEHHCKTLQDLGRYADEIELNSNLVANAIK